MAGKGKGGGHKRGGQHSGFVSRSQWRYAFATHQPWAHDKAVATTGTPMHGTPQGKAAFHRLPTRKGIRKHAG